MHTLRTAALLAATAALVLAAPRNAAAQGGLPDLNSLKPSASPAFVLLGVSPTDVVRPSSLPDVGLDVASASRSFTSLPQNYALEASPFWLRPRKALTWQADTARSVGQSLSRTLALSVATAQLGTADAPRTGVAGGFRTMLLSGHLSAATRDTLEQLARYLASEGALFERYAAPQRAVNDAWAAAELARIAAIADATDRQAQMQAFRVSNEARKTALVAAVTQNPAYQAEVEEGRRRFQDFALKRQGAMVEVAAGGAWGFADQVWQSGRLEKAGAWVTYGCQDCVLAGATQVTPLVLVRYTRPGGGALDMLDAGGRLVMEGGRFDLSAEGVVRGFLGTSAPKAQFRVAGIFDYQVNPALWLLASFGHDYQSTARGSLIAQLGLKFNFARQRYQP